MDEVFNAIANIGFPMAVSVYLLVRLESKLEGLGGSINELAREIGRLCEK